MDRLPNLKTSLCASWYKNYHLLIKKKISWKFPATSLKQKNFFLNIKKRVVDENDGKGVVDGVAGRVKSNAHTKVMSLGRDWIIVQDARSFCKLASTLCDKTTVIHVIADEIDTYKSEDPFANSVPIKDFSNACDQFKWRRPHTCG